MGPLEWYNFVIQFSPEYRAGFHVSRILLLIKGRAYNIKLITFLQTESNFSQKTPKESRVISNVLVELKVKTEVVTVTSHVL